MEGHEILEHLGVSGEELDTLKAFQETTEIEGLNQQKREAWMQSKIGKFGASRAVNLMGYHSETKEQAIKRLDNKYTKKELLAIANDEVLGLKYDIAKHIIDKGIVEYGVYAFPDGANTIVHEKVTEVLTGRSCSKDLNLPQLNHGNDTEAEAAIEFSIKTGIEVSQTGYDQVFTHWQTDENINVEYTDNNIKIPKMVVSLSDHAGFTADGHIDADIGLETKCPDSTTHLYYLESIKSADDLKSLEPKYYWQVQDSMMKKNAKAWYWVSYDPRFINKKHRLHIIKVDRHSEDINLLKIRTIEAIKRKVIRLSLLS